MININNNEKWDKIVKSFKYYDVYYLSGYSKALQLHGDGEPILFYYDDGNIRAINVVMKRDIEKDKNFTGKIPPGSYYDVTTPYGYGGFLIEGNLKEESLKMLDLSYSSCCRDNHIICEFVRFHPVIKNSGDIVYLYEITDLGRTVTMELNSQNQIWAKLAGKNRNCIRKAKKSGIKIYWGRNSELFDTFMTLYNVTMDKKKANDYYYFQNNFYNSILTDLKYNVLIFYAAYEDKIIAMSIVLFSNRQMHYHLSALDMKYQHLASANLLLYEAACWGCENGYKTFHLGGGLGSQEDSLFKFKEAFNKNSDTYFSVGRKIFDQEKYGKLIEIRKRERDFKEDTLFFPIYRG